MDADDLDALRDEFRDLRSEMIEMNATLREIADAVKGCNIHIEQTICSVDDPDKIAATTAAAVRRLLEPSDPESGE